eukprot:5437970-Alexandrium_andersonii.AAC.1
MGGLDVCRGLQPIHCHPARTLLRKHASLLRSSLWMFEQSSQSHRCSLQVGVEGELAQPARRGLVLHQPFAIHTDSRR